MINFLVCILLALSETVLLNLYLKAMGLSLLRCYYFGKNWENVFQKTIAACHRGFDNNGGAQMRWDSGGRNWIVYLSSLGATKVAYSKTEKRVILELDESASRRQLKTIAKR